MRRTYYDFGWILAEDGALLGLSLGYDRCGEHERGIGELLGALGVNLPEFPLGVAGRGITAAPRGLQFREFTSKPRDRRRKGYPTAMLSVHDGWDAPASQALPVADFVRTHEMEFIGEPGDKHWTATHDMAASWSARGFAVQVRGAENIERLKQVHAAFLAKDIAVGLPWAKAFFRGGLSFVFMSRMSQDAKDSVLEQDRAHLELHLAAQATGVEQQLQAAKKDYFALSPAWLDDHKDEVIFFLNPMKQSSYNGGWFAVSELVEWSQERGPVIRDAQLEAFAKQPENYNGPYRLLRGLNAAGIHMRHHEKLVWLDEAKTVPGLRIRVSRASEHLLASGDYPFAELMSRFAEPLQEAVSSTAGTPA